MPLAHLLTPVVARRIAWLALLACCGCSFIAHADEPPHKPQLPYQNPALTPLERAKDLVGRMSWEEKSRN